MSNQKIRVTVQFEDNDSEDTCTITQVYSKKYNRGHRKWAIVNIDGDVLGVGYTVGAPPVGKADTEMAEKIYNDWLIEEGY